MLRRWAALAGERAGEMTTYGTSHFLSRTAAMRYYSAYGYDNLGAAVDRKIAEGEISIGKPLVKAGERLKLIDGFTRWAVDSAGGEG